MSTPVHIKVPVPCHENWHNMTPKEQGRFCGSCQKVVVDFSKMSDKEMFDHFSKLAGQPVCGRFANDQLNRKIEPATHKPRFTMVYAWNLLLATVLFFESCKDRTTLGVIAVEKPTVKVVEEPTVGVVLLTEDTTHTKLPFEIKGKILCEGSGSPVAGAQVHIRGYNQKTITDSKGRFRLTGYNSNALTLEVSAQNFFSKTVQLNNKSDWQHIKVMLNEEAFIMGEIAADNNVTYDSAEDCKSRKQP